MGGMYQLASLVKKIRQEEENVLLFDAGDVFQGTPYFNLFNGELEFKLMSQIGYDAITLGNHDFDNGIDGLANQIKHTNFPIISSNYDFKNTPLENKTLPHHIIYKSGIKVGLFGLGIELKGLVDPKLYGNTIYQDPIVIANNKAKILKHQEHCDLVICLSHLGYKYKSEKVSDVLLASKTSNIDLIIGGHTHSFLNQAVKLKNKKNKEVLISQVGFGAIKLGKIDYYFNKKNLSLTYHPSNVESKSIKVLV